MEVKGGGSGSRYRNRNSPSSERSIGLFSRSQPENSNGDSILSSSAADDELDEDDVFWTGDFSQSNHNSNQQPDNNSSSKRNKYQIGFNRPEKFGILAALSEDYKKETLAKRPILFPSPLSSSSSSSSASNMISTIPKPQIPREKKREYFLSLPSGKFHHQSAPVNVPVLSKALRMMKPPIYEEDDNDEYEDEEDEMLPPHEIVARGSSRSPKTTFSVLEGVGRTLKGRDLRQVRNAVWRQTGFLD